MLEISNLSKSFGKNQNKRKVLNNINLTFTPGEIVFIVGKSGCGKSTLLKILGGLESVDEGQIKLDGKVIDHKDSGYKRNDVSFVFQEHNLIGGLDIKNNIAIAKKDYDREWIYKNVESLGILPTQNSHQLSGGESQRVAFLRALYKDAKILLADEPTGNLDRSTGQLLLEYLYQLKTQNKIVIVVSHDIEYARQYGDRLIEIEDGQVKSDSRIEHNNIIDESNDINNSNINSINPNYSITNNSNFEYNNTQYVAKDIIQLENKSTKKSSFYSPDLVMAKNNLLRHWIRSICLVLAMMIGISFFSITFAQYLDAKKQIDALAYMPNSDRVYITTYGDKEVSAGSIYGIDHLSVPEDTLENIASLSYVDAIIPIFEPTNDWSSIPGATNSLSQHSNLTLTFDLNDTHDTISDTDIYTSIISIDSTKVFENKYMHGVQGNFIQNENEIILDKDTALAVFDSVDVIGKTLYVFLNGYHTNFANETVHENYAPKGMPLTIVGVDTDKHEKLFGDYVDQKYEVNMQYVSFVHYNVFKNLIKLNGRDIINDGYGTVDIDVFNGGSSAEHYYSTSVVDSVESIIDGKIPDDSSMSIMFNKSFLDSIGDNDYSNLKNIAVSFFLLYGGSIDNKIKFPVSISGIMVTPNLDSDTVYLSKKVIDTLQTPAPVGYEIYLKNPKLYGQLDSFLNSGDMKFGLQSKYAELLRTIGNPIEATLLTFLVLSIIILVIVVLFISILLRVVSSSRIYEIGILKSLGYSVFGIVRLFVYEFVPLAILGTALSYIINPMIVSGITSISDSLTVILLNPSFLVGLFVGFCMFLLCSILTTLFVGMLAKKKTAVLLEHSKRQS